MNQPLTYMDGETLMNTVLPPIRFVISQLPPQGLHVLAGAPKVGKSWLSLWLCLQVAKGKPAWEFPTTQGDVLYLCLEDSYSRIQNRLLDITDDAPPVLRHHVGKAAQRTGAADRAVPDLTAGSTSRRAGIFSL